jgi:hypothetical protein
MLEITVSASSLEVFGIQPDTVLQLQPHRLRLGRVFLPRRVAESLCVLQLGQSPELFLDPSHAEMRCELRARVVWSLARVYGLRTMKMFNLMLQDVLLAAP